MEWFMIMCTFIGTMICMAMGSLIIGAVLVRKKDHSKQEYAAMVFVASWLILLSICSCMSTLQIVM